MKTSKHILETCPFCGDENDVSHDYTEDIVCDCGSVGIINSELCIEDNPYKAEELLGCSTEMLENREPAELDRLKINPDSPDEIDETYFTQWFRVRRK